MTHTFALIEVSAAAYDEIAAKLREAGYGHAFQDVAGDDGPAVAIDMHGLALVTPGAVPDAPTTLGGAPAEALGEIMQGSISKS